MKYLLAYFLLALSIDLIRHIVRAYQEHRFATSIRRRLWSDNGFDCRSQAIHRVMGKPMGLRRVRQGICSATRCRG